MKIGEYFKDKKRVIRIACLLLIFFMVIGLFIFLEVQKESDQQANLTDKFVRLEDYIKNSSRKIENPSIEISATKKTDKVATPNTFVCDKSTDFSCFETYYRAIVKNDGIEAAFSDLKVRYNTNGYIKAMCHPLAHIIGQEAAMKFSNVAEAYLHGDDFCWAGYYHGIIEGLALKLGKPKLLAGLNNFCDSLPGKKDYKVDYYECLHGLGHGLMEITNDELFESLDHCGTLTGEWERQSCYGGVFMENVIIDNKNHFTKFLKPEDPTYPCSAVEDKYKNPCYLIQTGYMLKVAQEDFVKVFDTCSKVDGVFKNTCYQSLGRDASGHSSSDIAITKMRCNLGTDFAQRSNCVIGAVKDFVYHYYSDVQAKQFCAALDQDLQQTCYTTEENYYKSFQK